MKHGRISKPQRVHPVSIPLDAALIRAVDEKVALLNPHGEKVWNRSKVVRTLLRGWLDGPLDPGQVFGSR